MGLNQLQNNVLAVSVLALLIVDYIKYKSGELLGSSLARQNVWFRALSLIALLLGIVIFGIYGPEYDTQQFIYFQF
jgi:hypothetical protein